MKTKVVLVAMVVALCLAPVIALGAFLLVPVALLLVAVLPALAVGALSTLVLSGTRTRQPAMARVHVSVPTSVTSSR